MAANTRTYVRMDGKEATRQWPAAQLLSGPTQRGISDRMFEVSSGCLNCYAERMARRLKLWVIPITLTVFEYRSMSTCLIFL